MINIPFSDETDLSKRPIIAKGGLNPPDTTWKGWEFINNNKIDVEITESLARTNAIWVVGLIDCDGGGAQS